MGVDLIGFFAPPRGANEGRKYFFFIDYLQDPLELLTVWDGYSPYWQYHASTKNYQRVSPPHPS